MGRCNICKQREAKLTATVEGKGTLNLCPECHQAIPPKKRTTHIAWKLKGTRHPVKDEFNRRMRREVRSLQRDYM